MRFDSLNEFLGRGKAALDKGPVLILICEDAVAIAGTIAHALKRGFRAVLAFAPAGIAVDMDDPRVVAITFATRDEAATETIVNAMIAAAPADTWLSYAYNSEYLFYPFCEHRNVVEFTTFLIEERRRSVLTYVVDLYARDMAAHPDAVAPKDACLDRVGYYALVRRDRAGNIAERQLDFYGGLRWRFEEHVPPDRRRIDRIALFRTEAGLCLRGDHTFSIAEYNTYASPWHNSPTAALCSFRTAKALRTNPGSRAATTSFHWHNSVPFAWTSQQLGDLGLIEPGQWF